MKVISLGMGMQSTAMYLMSCLGEIERADYAVFADPGAEHPLTYMTSAWLIQAGFDIPIIVINNNIVADILGKKRVASLPYFTKNGGMVRRQCTMEYKVQPVMKEIRNLYGLRKGQRMKPTEVWLGITTDEADRIKESQQYNIVYRYPLAIELGLSRGDCINWMKKNGFEIPIKSSCIFCPYQSDKSWKKLKENSPRCWETVVMIDNKIRKMHNATENWFLHKSRKPISEIDFDTEQLDMFGEECEGYCGL